MSPQPYTFRRSLIKGVFTLLLIVPAIAAGSGPTTATSPVPPDKIITYLRQRFHIPDSVKVTLSDFRESIYQDFYQTDVVMDDGKDKRSEPFFVSKDGRYLVEGNIYTLDGDPYKEIGKLISLDDQPVQGPPNAPVTLVEYADLQCPMCANFHGMIENEIIPKYGDKLRVVFKEFPLSNIHDWALTAAIAAQCVYQINPEQYVAFRSLVYQNQVGMDADHIRDKLLHLAAEAGVDNMKLAACIDAKTSLPRVEASTREGQTLGIASTPTSFVNGHVVVGGPTLADISKIIDDALKNSK
jgi:protein-disulfide isomerase